MKSAFAFDKAFATKEDIDGSVFWADFIGSAASRGGLNRDPHEIKKIYFILIPCEFVVKIEDARVQ